MGLSPSKVSDSQISESLSEFNDIINRHNRINHEDVYQLYDAISSAKYLMTTKYRMNAMCDKMNPYYAERMCNESKLAYLEQLIKTKETISKSKLWSKLSEEEIGDMTNKNFPDHMV